MEEMHGFKEELKRFAEMTSIRGIPKIIKTNNKFLKVVWLIFVLDCSSILIFLLTLQFTKFYQWPVTTTFGEKLDGQIIFPDETLCNLNPFVDGYHEKTFVKQYYSMINAIDVEIQQKLPLNQRKVFQFFKKELSALSGIIANLPKRFSLPEDCPSFITECYLYSKYWMINDSCENDFITRWNADNYVCSTIETSKLNYVNSTDIRGMSLILNIGPPLEDQLQYYTYITSAQARGIRIAILPPGTSPNFKTSLTLSPGTQTILTLTQTNVQRLDKPYNPFGCTDQQNISSKENEPYSQDMCFQFCKQFETYERCQCVGYWFPIPTSLSDAPICYNLSDKIEEKYIDIFDIYNMSACVYDAYSSDEVCEDECPLSCNETSYTFTQSSFLWPPTFLQLNIFNNYFNGCMS